MKRETVEKTLKDFGFNSSDFEEDSHKQNGKKYEKKSADNFNINVNGTELYLQQYNHCKIEVDDWGIVIRIMYDYHYVGCIVQSWEDLNEFELREGY